MPARIESLVGFVVVDPSSLVHSALGEERVVVQDDSSGYWENFEHITGTSSAIMNSMSVTAIVSIKLVSNV